MKVSEMKRTLKAASLLRLEEAARTVEDFQSLVKTYDRLEDNRERKERYWEVAHKRNEILAMQWDAESVLPPPLDHPWWRELMRGDFTSVIHDCPYDLHELVSSRNVSQIIRSLDENRKEILYYRAVWQWSPQRIAALRCQSDRNIRKVYDVTIRKIRKELYNRLRYRYENDIPLTEEQRIFVRGYIESEGESK